MSGVDSPATFRAAGFAIERPRLIDWMTRREEVRIRLVSAPMGFGKSQLLRWYVETRPQARYLSFETIRAQSPGTVAEQIASAGDREIALDDVQMQDCDLLENFLTAVDALQPFTRVIVASSSREVIRQHRWFIEGTAEMLGPAALSFDTLELSHICKRYGVDHRGDDLEQLLRETDGWPIVANAVIRHARFAKQPLARAFESWLQEYGPMLRETVASALTAESPNILAETWAPSMSDLRDLERRGLFVIRRTSHYELLQPVQEIINRDVNGRKELRIRPMLAQFLGEFQVCIHGKRIEWLRRKDAHIFKYLLLSPDGRATRSELTRVFWPRHDPPQARQNLRTACSNIRAALRECVPAEEVDAYFSCDPHIVTVGTALLGSDLEDFTAHFDTALEMLQNGMVPQARESLRAAKAFYHGSLYVDPPGSFYDELSREIDRRFGKVQQMLTRPERESLPLRDRSARESSGG